jgi:hypothetical protein
MSGLAMHHPRDCLPALDRIEAALEATCAALMTLESMNPGSVDAIGGAAGTEAHVQLAISRLRDAVEELRLAQSDGSSALAIGFVLKRKGGEAGAVEPDPG